MYDLSKLIHFDSVYLYNILDCTSELYMDNLEISINIEFEVNDGLTVNNDQEVLNVKTDRPWLFPYDKVLIPNLNE